jgi:hypothetical protein
MIGAGYLSTVSKCHHIGYTNFTFFEEVAGI